MISKTIGNKLCKLRKAKNWSQEETAERLNISRSAYQRIENGECDSWPKHFERINKIFNLPPEELFKKKNPETNSYVKNTPLNASLAVKELITQYELRLKEKDEIIALLKQKVTILKSV